MPIPNLPAHDTIVGLARRYEDLGWQLAPLATYLATSGECRQHPRGGWPTALGRLDDGVLGQIHGVALVLGPSGVVDIDLDSDEARVLAPVFLRPTATFGRKGRVTHYVYVTDPVPHPDNGGPPRSEQAKNRAFKWPDGEAIGGHATIVELRRGPGCQTTPPPTVKPDGFPAEWSGPGWVEDLVLWGPEDETRVENLALACILMRSAWESGRHASVLSFAGELAMRGVPETRALEIIGRACEARGDEGLEDRDRCVRDTYARHSRGEAVVGVGCMKTRAVIGSIVGARGAGAGGAGRRVNMLAPLTEVLDGVAAGLGAQEPVVVYRQGTGLVTIDGPISAQRLVVEIARSCNFVRSGSEGDKPAHPNAEIARLLMEASPALPELVGRRAGPVVRPDGSVRVEAGYDAETQVWCDGWAGPPVPDVENIGQAAGLLASVLGWVDVGQWKEDYDAVAWLGHVLTVAARVALGDEPVPVWVYTAPGPGSGKTALARSAGLVGGLCGVVSTPLGMGDVEIGRLLHAQSSSAALVLDNLHATIRAPSLEAAVTGGTLSARPLYRPPVEIPWRTVLSFTSNGAEFGSDWVRRSIPVRVTGMGLDSKRDILREFEEGRCASLVADVAGVAAWMIRENFGGVEGLPGFARWSGSVAAGLAAVGLCDLTVLAREAALGMVDGGDSDSELLDAIEAWKGVEEFTSRELWESPKAGAVALRECGAIVCLGRRLTRLRDSSRVVVSRVVRGRNLFRINTLGGGDTLISTTI